MPKTHSPQPVTQEDVARHAGVSRSIVSYVLNNGPRKVSAETRSRVLAAIQELGYRPNKYAQRLKLGANAAQNSIGIIAGGKGYNLLERPYYSVILASLFDTAHQLNQRIRFFSFFDALKDPIFFNKNIHAEEISSILLLLPALITADPEHEQVVTTMMEHIDNIICLENSIYSLPALIVDLLQAAQLAVEHLISLGHQRIGFLCVDRETDGRAVGYKRTLMMHNLAPDTRLMRYVGSADLLTKAYNLTLDLIQSNPDMTAIFAANDEIAVAALAALQDNGLKVPDDIALVSIDNTKISSMVRPALTTVNIPINEMGEYALRMLIAQREHALDLPMSMVLPIELVVRESCGASKTRQPNTREQNANY
jgi:DNA-binding LacI/PurR family transcriptional regulator